MSCSFRSVTSSKFSLSSTPGQLTTTASVVQFINTNIISFFILSRYCAITINTKQLEALFSEDCCLSSKRGVDRRLEMETYQRVTLKDSFVFRFRTGVWGVVKLDKSNIFKLRIKYKDIFVFTVFFILYLSLTCLLYTSRCV